MSLAVAVLVAIIHVYIFLLESVLWGTKKVNKTFKVKLENVEVIRLWAFNQGFYNLFLALGIFAGALLIYMNKGAEGRMVIDFAVACVFFAGLVLGYSTNKLKSGLIQSGPAIVYFVLRFLNF